MTNLVTGAVVVYLLIGVAVLFIIQARGKKERQEPNGRIVWDRQDNPINTSFWFTVAAASSPTAIFLCILLWPFLALWNFWKGDD